MDISVRLDTGVFNLRAAGILICDDRVLLQKADDDDFWALPGGRCQLSETSSEALKREFIEETEIEIVPERLIWLVENFFTYRESKFHEVGFYYQVTAAVKAVPQQPFRGKKDSRNLSFQWFDINLLEDINLRPGFLTTRLKVIPEFTERLVVNDIKTTN